MYVVLKLLYVDLIEKEKEMNKQIGIWYEKNKINILRIKTF